MMNLKSNVLLSLLLVSVGCNQTVEPSPIPYTQRLAEFHTKLTTTGPAPQDFDQEVPFDNVKEIKYQSGDLSLKAWVYTPPGEATAPRPALMFLHGGFAFGAGDLEACQIFMDAGYVVMCPMLRGENGNPGAFEMFLGEADDAKAAAEWLAEQPNVDKSRIFVFGHSVGGGVSAMLSLRENVPVQHSGSSGGLYPREVFIGWSDDCPFNYRDQKECEMRTLFGNIQYMKFPHYAYLGSQDAFGAEGRAANAEQAKAGGQLTVSSAPGDHFSSFEPALRQYLVICEQSR